MDCKRDHIGFPVILTPMRLRVHLKTGSRNGMTTQTLWPWLAKSMRIRPEVLTEVAQWSTVISSAGGCSNQAATSFFLSSGWGTQTCLVGSCSYLWFWWSAAILAHFFVHVRAFWVAFGSIKSTQDQPWIRFLSGWMAQWSFWWGYPRLWFECWRMCFAVGFRERFFISFWVASSQCFELFHVDNRFERPTLAYLVSCGMKAFSVASGFWDDFSEVLIDGHAKVHLRVHRPNLWYFCQTAPLLHWTGLQCFATFHHGQGPSQKLWLGETGVTTDLVRRHCAAVPLHRGKLRVIHTVGTISISIQFSFK